MVLDPKEHITHMLFIIQTFPFDENAIENVVSEMAAILSLPQMY